MSKKRQRNCKPWQTRGFFILSMLSILVISGAIVATVLLYGGKDENIIIADSVWLDENIWRVQSYKQRKDGKYDVRLLDIQTAYESSFEELCETYRTTPYSAFNSYNVRDGVGCQGMVCYIASWCDRNAYEYSVAWTPTHVWIYVEYGDIWYKFDFASSGATLSEVMQRDVQKGMVLE